MNRDTVLFLDFHPEQEGSGRKLAGIRRFARTQGWETVAVPSPEARAARVRPLLARYRPVGCIVERASWDEFLPLSLFGRVPVVYLDPQDPSQRLGAPAVVCDNAAVARMAFRELSAGMPPCLAAVPSPGLPEWNFARLSAFEALCAEAGIECRVFDGKRNEDPALRIERLARWLSTLPRRSGVFGTNDNAARDVVDAAMRIPRHIPKELVVLGVDGSDAAEFAVPVTSIKLDLEQAGYLAARLLAEANDGRRCAANDGRRCAANDGRRCAANDGGAARRMTNDGDSVIAAAGGPSLRPEAARHCRRRRPVIAAGGRTSLPPPQAAAAFGPLLAVRRRSTQGPGRREPLILEAVDVIRREAGEGLTAAALAARFPVSRKHFERRFREAMGHSVLDEILHVRLGMALDMLSQSHVPIGTIADFCGFGTQRGLRKLFRARFGTSMEAWRESHGIS